MEEGQHVEELEKKYEEQLGALTAQMEQARKRAELATIHSEFTKVATGAGITYIDDAIALADLSSVSIDESGKVIGLDDVVKGLVDNKPFLVTKKTQQAIGESSNSGRQSQERTADQILAETAAKAKASGSIRDRVAYSALERKLKTTLGG